MRVVLTRTALVRFAAGAELEVSEQEAARLVMLCNAKVVKEAAEEKKPAKKGKK